MKNKSVSYRSANPVEMLWHDLADLLANVGECEMLIPDRESIRMRDVFVHFLDGFRPFITATNSAGTELMMLRYKRPIFVGLFGCVCPIMWDVAADVDMTWQHLIEL